MKNLFLIIKLKSKIFKDVLIKFSNKIIINLKKGFCKCIKYKLFKENFSSVKDFTNALINLFIKNMSEYNKYQDDFNLI